MTPADTLATYPVLTMTQLAYVLNLTHRRGASKGMPDRRRALNLCRTGALPVIDPTLPWALWTVSATNVRRYIDGTIKATA